MRSNRYRRTRRSHFDLWMLLIAVGGSMAVLALLATGVIPIAP